MINMIDDLYPSGSNSSNYMFIDPDSYHFGTIEQIIHFIEIHQRNFLTEDTTDAIIHTRELLKRLKNTQRYRYELTHID